MGERGFCSTRDKPTGQNVLGAKASKPDCSPVSRLPMTGLGPVFTSFLGCGVGTRGAQRVPVPRPRSVLPAGWGVHFAFCCLPVLLCGRCVGKERERPRAARGQALTPQRLRWAGSPAPGLAGRVQAESASSASLPETSPSQEMSGASWKLLLLAPKAQACHQPRRKEAPPGRGVPSPCPGWETES